MANVIYYRAFKNISDKLNIKTTVLYLAENQAWEKALNFTFHDKISPKVIGILHTVIPLVYLPYFDSEGPKPDYFACSGEIPLELLKAFYIRLSSLTLTGRKE